MPQVTVIRTNYARGIRIPWRLKMLIKVGLSPVPLPYKLTAKAGICRHGDLDRSAANVVASFRDHLSACRSVPTAVLELGPGDSIGHALCFRAAGIGRGYLVDAGDFATRDQLHYKDVADHLDLKENDRPPSWDRETILSFCNTSYLTGGLASLRSLPDQSVDFSFSHAVLEHIHRDEFSDLMRELFRIHRPGGLSRHWVDLHDHLGGALNSLRFPAWLWESALIRRAGFYTNRLGMDEMVDHARAAGFSIRIEKIKKWEKLPTPRAAMAAPFRSKAEDDLNICTFLIVMEK